VDKLGTRDTALIVSAWPRPGRVDAEAKREVEWLIALIGNLRGAKVELGLAPGARLEAYLPEQRHHAHHQNRAIPAIAVWRVCRRSIRAAPRAPMQIGAGDASLIVPLEGLIDVAAEKARLAKAMAASRRSGTRSTSACRTRPSWKRPSPRPSTRPAPTTPIPCRRGQRLAAALARG
jgi:valyl-tRNA synthetase